MLRSTSATLSCRLTGATMRAVMGSPVADVYGGGECREGVAGDVERRADLEAREPGQPGESRDAGVRDPRRFPELELLERGHPRQQCEAGVGNQRATGIVALETGQARDMLGGGVSSRATVHAPQFFQLGAAADMAEAV